MPPSSRPKSIPLVSIILPVAFILIFIGVACFVFFAGRDGAAQQAEARAAVFVRHLKSANYEDTVKDFGGNTCRCPAELGWVSYLIYGSGEEPNLAALLGRDFVSGGMKCKKMTSKAQIKTVLDKPQDYEVSVPISFAPGQGPWFLPLDTAYGYTIDKAAFDAFIANPDQKAWQGLTLRMRNDLSPTSCDISPAAQKLITRNKKRMAELGIINQALGDNPKDPATRYITPRAPGLIEIAPGKTVPLSDPDLSQKLPRLASATLRLHMVRHDQIHPFTVFHFVLSDPVLEMANGERLVMRSFKPPLVER